MANTKIPSELSSTPSISDSGDATAITIDSSENVAVTGNLSAAKLTSNNGVLELDDNGSHNGIINVPASISINIDSDDGATTETFTISKDKTAINDTDVLFRIAESGNAVFGNSSTANGDVTISNAGAEQLELYAGSASNVNTFQHYNRSTSNYVDAKYIANNHIFQSGGTEVFRTSGSNFSFNAGTGNLGNKYMVINAGTSNDGGFILQRDNTNQWQIVNGTTDGDLLFYSYGTSSTALYIDRSNGHVGISNTSPNNLLTVGSSSLAGYPYRHQNGTGSYYMGHGNQYYHHHEQSGASVGFYWGSACVANGGFSAYSDERLKENITTIDGALDKVALMDGITFTWKDTEARGSDKQFGVTAQNMLEVDSALPVLSGDALASQEDVENPDINTDFYTFDYARLTPYFIEAIKELKTKLEAAEARITELEG